ncbi:MAG: VTT domain-containing protein [Opitutales bacterium]|nr:VTT domain-containing protein [Opitutales bacterium]
MVEKAPLRRFFLRFRLWIILGAVFSGCLVLAAVVAAATFDIGGSLEAGRVYALEVIRLVPAWLYLLMIVVLPLVGVPVSLFFFTAIPVLGGPGGLYGIVGAWAGIGAGMSLAYWLSGGILRPYLADWMEKRGYAVPAVRRENEWKVILAVRLSPLPYLVQNYSLGLSGCRFPVYLLISWPTQGLIGLGFMLVGESFATGGMRYAILGLFLITLCFLATGYLRRRIDGGGRDERAG